MFENSEYVACVLKEQGFVKAAEKLHVSQPALSAMIKRIEDKVGGPLFNRRQSPITLTALGAEYMKYAEQVQELEAQFTGHTSEYLQLKSGRLTVSGSNLSCDYLVPRTIARFKLAYPGVILHAVDADTLSAKQRADNREVDFFITTKPLNNAEYHQIPFFREELLLAVPKDANLSVSLRKSALSRKEIGSVFELNDRQVPLTAFRDIPYILLSSGNHHRTCTDALFREAGYDPEIAAVTDESSISLNLVAAGIGATFCSSLLLENSPYLEKMCVYKLDSKLTIRIGNLCYRSKSYVSPIMEKFLEFARENSNIATYCKITRAIRFSSLIGWLLLHFCSRSY